MMKMFPSILLFMIPFFKNFHLNLSIYILTMINLLYFFNLNFKLSLTSSVISLDYLSTIMLMLTLISVILIMLSSSNIMKIFMTMIPITLILMMTFSSKNMLMFYIMFELVLIPTMILITMNGKQPERLQASLYLIMYTVTASLPLLISIIYMNLNNSFLYINMMMLKHSLIIFIMMAFLVKMPMYFTHLWLPKAHVEAPLEGSMILAAILLKLGGYGIIRFMSLCIPSINKMNYWIISISLIGATATSMNCIRQKDLKSLIAYSSVAHMAFVLTGLFTTNYIGLSGSILMMIAHGLSSSALFLLVNDLYYKYHSRNILMFKGLMTIMPNMTFWWFMFMAMNISAPPTINTLSEVFMMSSLITWNNNSIMMIFIMSFMTASFSLMMFIKITHNKNEMSSSIQTPYKIFLSLFIHLIPSIILIMKPEILLNLLFSLMKTMVCGTMISSINFTSTIMISMTMILYSLAIMSLYKNMFFMVKLNLMKVYSIQISIDIMLDWMSMFFLSTVILISSMIIFFSKYYIPIKEHKQFMLMLIMFVLSMSILIISNNLFLTLLGWDGLGLSSYILVVYYQNFSSAASGTITLMSNRMGDILILLSMGILTISSNWNFNLNSEFPYMVLLLLMMASCSKSAQFPFSAWLPMAMAAPTPISALVHSSTLVTAGVFLMLRISTFMHSSSMMIMLMISSLTAIYASMSANWEQDLKKIIALSTLSQIAMMMFAIAMNSLILAFIHLIIHALFKSTMFLCAGNMIHESSYQDMRMMSFNFSNHPLTLSILGINSMALMGIPFMSGFFSKDMIIEMMIFSKLNMTMSILMITSIGMTASYTIRMSLFSNKSNFKNNPLISNHQSYNSMIPIMILSLFAITSGSWITWLMYPCQLFMLNLFMKMSILTSLILGFMTGLSLQFKNKKFIKMGLISISLWFNHYLSVIPTNLFSPLMQYFHNIDKQWQENYGPKNSYNSMSMMTMVPENFKSSLMMILIMITLIPLFIM